MSSTAAMRSAAAPGRRPAGWKRQLRQVNRELWLLLAIFVIGGVLNTLLASERMVLGFYTLPTVVSAYLYGRRHAVLTAFASVFLVVLLTLWNPAIFAGAVRVTGEDNWFDVTVWGGTLVVTAYLMGTLYERKEAHLRDLRHSYEGILTMLQTIATDNKYSQNHPYRVGIMATKVAEEMGLSARQIEEVRSAAMLHEVDKAGISWNMLYQAANMSEQEAEAARQELQQGRPAPVGDTALRRIIAIILGHQVAMERAAKGAGPPAGPLESQILLVADAYDSLTSARTARIAPSEAMERIEQRSGIEYDAEVVEAMVKVFRKRGMERLEPAYPAGD
jgi:hypothetical protein